MDGYWQSIVVANEEIVTSLRKGPHLFPELIGTMFFRPNNRYLKSRRSTLYNVFILFLMFFGHWLPIVVANEEIATS